MKIKAVVNENYIKNTFSFDIIDNHKNILAKGQCHNLKEIEDGLYIRTSFANITAELKFYDKYLEYHEIRYITDKYIKI